MKAPTNFNTTRANLGFYLYEKRMTFLSGYIDKIDSINRIQSILYGIYTLKNSDIRKIYVNNFWMYDDDLIMFLDILSWYEITYYTTGYGLLSNQSLAVLISGEQHHRKVFPNASIYIYHGKATYLDRYEMFSANSFSNMFHTLILNRYIRTIYKNININNTKVFTNEYHIFERNFFISNLEAIEFGIIDNVIN